MSYESRTGLGTMSQYGARETGTSIGVEHSQDSKHQLSIEITADGLVDKFLPPLVIPKGAKIEKAVITVDVAPAGVTALSFGEGNTEATNGITLAAADLAIGTRDVTSKLAGTWAGTAAAYVTKASRVGMAVTGANTVKNARASLVIDFRYKRRKDDEWAVDVSTQPTGYRPQFKG